MANIIGVVEGIIDLIKKNIIAKSNLIQNAYIGNTYLNVANTFQYNIDDEIVIIDYGYNVEGSIHYQIYEYAKIKNIINTHTIQLYTAILSNWNLSDHAFIQKTIGHSPLYEEQVYYGDREVIPTDMVAVTVEATDLSNEWLYLQGGLSETSNVDINIYSKNIKFEDGRKILDRYTDSIYKLLNNNIHIDINNHESPLLENVSAGSYIVKVEDNALNREKFVASSSINEVFDYQLQDNLGVSCNSNVDTVVISGGIMTITMSDPICCDFTLANYGVFRRLGRYFYDTRIDNATYGVISKGSAVLRSSKLHWFGKEMNEIPFPQRSNGVEYFEEIYESSSSS